MFSWPRSASSQNPIFSPSRLKPGGFLNQHLLTVKSHFDSLNSTEHAKVLPVSDISLHSARPNSPLGSAIRAVKLLRNGAAENSSRWAEQEPDWLVSVWEDLAAPIKLSIRQLLETSVAMI